MFSYICFRKFVIEFFLCLFEMYINVLKLNKPLFSFMAQEGFFQGPGNYFFKCNHQGR